MNLKKISGAFSWAYHNIRRRFKPHEYWTEEELTEAKEKARQLYEVLHTGQCSVWSYDGEDAPIVVITDRVP